MRQIPYTGPNIAGYCSLVIKVYKKRRGRGGVPLKGGDLVSCHPSSGGATSSSPRRRLAIKNQTRMETVLRCGGASRRLWKGGRCQWAGVIWRLVMMVALVVMQGFKMSAGRARRSGKQAEGH